MITQEEAKRICSKTRLIDIEMLNVIERYIFDKKQTSVIINRPTNVFDINLMNVAFESACNYYLNL